MPVPSSVTKEDVDGPLDDVEELAPDETIGQYLQRLAEEEDDLNDPDFRVSVLLGHSYY